jgi:sugar phosphate isomerase/epimerase
VIGSLGIEHQTALGLPPVELVTLAAQLDCPYLGIVLSTRQYNPHDYPPYSLLDDAALRRRMIAAMDDSGVSVFLGDGLVVYPDLDVREYERQLDVMAELGTSQVNTVSFDPDLARSLDGFAQIADMAAARGLSTTLEFAPSLTIKTLDAALDAVRQVGRPDFGLLIDTMHLIRAGNTAADLAAVDPSLIRHVQLSDNTIRQRGAVYREDTIDRMVPGAGELPLGDILAAVPDDVPIGLEVPMLSRALAGESTEDSARLCVEGARALLATLNEGRENQA